MKIVIFLENIQSGGVDTFCENLINHWPNNDDFIFFCNKSHPGFVNIQNNVNKKCNFLAHKIPISWNILKKFPIVSYQYIRFLGPLVRFMFLPIQFYKIRRLLIKHEANALISVSGSYPGGETSRIASIVWGQLGFKGNIFNFHNFAMLPRFGLGWYESLMDRLLVKHVDLFISVSETCIESLRIRPAFSLLHNLTYIYNGVSLNDNNIKTLNINSKFKIPSGSFICLMLATYEKRKGHEFIFKAFEIASKLKEDMYLVICGSGTIYEKEEVQLLRNKIISSSKVHLSEFIPNGSELIKQSNILLIGSQAEESFGYTAIEAMQSEIPVISTNCGGLPEVIGKNGDCGFLVENDDIENFAKHIIELYENKSLYKLITRNAKLRFEDNFQAKTMARKYMEQVLLLNK